MIRKSLVLLAAVATVLTAPAYAGPVMGFRLPPGGVRPTLGNEPAPVSGGMLNEWRFQRDWHDVAQSYTAALGFAECLNRLRPTAARDVLVTPIGAPGDREELVRLARSTPGCIGETGPVAPLLLRAALAESVLRSDSTAPWPNRASGSYSVGVPESVDAYPIAAISRCQVSVAPTLVAQVLQTRPGGKEEALAVETLFGSAPQCGARHPGRLTPTAARLALIDAALLRGQ